MVWTQTELRNRPLQLAGLGGDRGLWSGRSRSSADLARYPTGEASVLGRGDRVVRRGDASDLQSRLTSNAGCGFAIAHASSEFGIYNYLRSRLPLPALWNQTKTTFCEVSEVSTPHHDSARYSSLCSHSRSLRVGGSSRQRCRHLPQCLRRGNTLHRCAVPCRGPSVGPSRRPGDTLVAKAR
jgi:hypothetical protein